MKTIQIITLIILALVIGFTFGKILTKKAMEKQTYPTRYLNSIDSNSNIPIKIYSVGRSFWMNAQLCKSDSFHNFYIENNEFYIDGKKVNSTYLNYVQVIS